MKLNIIFVGTSEFGIPSLRRLYKEKDININLVITREDKPKGRGYRLSKPPIKLEAETLNLNILQPVSINNQVVIDRINKIRPDYIVVVAYGEKLSNEILKLPKIGAVNLHASLLPELRGASPINWAIIRGYERTGVTTILMTDEIDAGEILLQTDSHIDPNEDAGMLSERLSVIGAEILLSTLIAYAKGRVRPKLQDETKKTIAPKIKEEHCLIDWSKSAKEIHNLIRGLSPTPLALSYINEKRVKISKSELSDYKVKGKQGEIVDIIKSGAIIITGYDCILVSEVQFEGGKKTNPYHLLQGRLLSKGMVFGK
ncbi:MAG: methionyl-tRNA formyltransferase [bacterium]